MSLNASVQEQLKQMIATMLMVPEVGPGTSLAALNTSLGSAKVRLGLKRLGLALPAGAKPATYGGLVAALSGEAASVAAAKAETVARPAAPAGNGEFAGLQVGLDVEDIRSLPAAVDYWEHEFYRATFARSEIAYAALHSDPRTHFAGFWCAKEALLKCDGAFAGVSLERIAVSHDPDGRPYLTLESGMGPERLPHAVSISHTAEVATAVVVLSSYAPPVVVLPAAATVEIVPVAEAKKSRGLAKLFGI